MFDLFPMLLSSVASFLFPIFASYKALKTSDPAQLTPWLMYWVVFSCCILVESWLSWVIIFIPFYGYLRLFFLLYLILPQTQGARLLYESHVHPFLEDNEAQIDDFIASAHDRLKSAGLAYFRQAVEYVKTAVLGVAPSENRDAGTAAYSSSSSGGVVSPQGYTQALLARFSVPAARWTGTSGNAGGDFYNLLASAVSAATSAGRMAGVGGSSGGNDSLSPDMTASGTLIPPSLRNSQDKMSFIAAQRERLAIVLSALDAEAQSLQRADPTLSASATMGHAADNDEPTQRPPSGLSMWSALSKSRSEADFEKIEAESGAEDDGALRRRKNAHNTGASAGGSWIPWGWGAGSTGVDAAGGSPMED